MKITLRQLRRIIKEEVGAVNEQEEEQEDIEQLQLYKEKTGRYFTTLQLTKASLRKLLKDIEKWQQGQSRHK